MNSGAQNDILNERLPLNGLHLLLVDDCEDNQFLFKRLLTRKGALVSVANDGIEGLELINKLSFDSVLLDIQMPVMDGFQTMEHLKARQYKAPVIALTGCNHPSEKESILQAGFASIVSKPVEATVLVETILDVVRDGSASVRTQ